MVTFVSRDGQRLTPYMLAQINRLDTDFFAAFGYHIVVSSGIRTSQEQIDIFLQRYVTAGNINGRKVYDTRTWRGQTWYRISSAGTVATPGTSNHEIQGNTAAVDIRDTGPDAGVMTASSTRGRWVRVRIRNYDMYNSGDSFGEGWHFDVYNIGNDGGAGGGGGSGFPARDKHGAAWVEEIQKKANRLGAGLEVDGKDGTLTQNWIKRVQKYNGLEQDGVAGPDTNSILDKILNLEVDGQLGKFTIQRLQYAFGAEPDGEWGPATSKLIQAHLKVDPDGDFGVNSWKAFQRALGFTGSAVDGDPGVNTYKALQNWLNSGTALTPVPETPTPPTPTPEPVPGRNASSRATAEIQKKLGVPETGVWDLATANAVKAYQTSKFIDADAVYGSFTDGFMFPPPNYGFGVDYSFARPDLQMLKDRGVIFIARYLWKLKYDDGVRTNKGLSKEENDQAEALGLEVVFIYEEDGKELNKGFDAGVRVAKEAEKYRIANGLPVKPIYFNVDYDAQQGEFAAIIEALKGVASVIGLDRVGLYAGYNVVKMAFDAGVIKWGMQTYAWSGGLWDSRAQLRQWANGQYGGSVDFQYAMAPEYGQSEIVPIPDPEPEPEPEPEPKPENPGPILEIDRDELVRRRAQAAGLVAFFDALLTKFPEA